MQTIDTVPSSSLDFTGQKTLGVVASTSHVEIAPKFGGIYKAGDTIRIEIPSQNWLDGEKFRLTFRGQAFDGGAAVPLYGGGERYPLSVDTAESSKYCMFKNGVQHVFSRVKLLQGSRVIEDIQEYGQLAHLMHVLTIPDDHMDEILNKEGFCDSGDFDGRQERKIQATKWNGHLYEVELFLGLFRTGKYLPTKYMGQLTIELYLETNTKRYACLSISRNCCLCSYGWNRSLDSWCRYWTYSL